MTVSAIPKWKIEDDEQVSMSKSFSTGSLAGSTISQTTSTEDFPQRDLQFNNSETTSSQKVPFIFYPKAVKNRSVDDLAGIKIRPVWSKHGQNLRLLSSISFEMKTGREYIGQNYGITNQIFTSKYEKIEINLEKSNSINEGFAFGVKSELETTQDIVFLRQLDSDCSCLVDFSSSQSRGRCLIPSNVLKSIFNNYKKSRLGTDKIKVLKRDEDIFISFNFVSNIPRNAFYRDTV